ncbi:hypothetical protein ACQ5SO_01555 [Rhodovulum sp. DZ06]|uniref:hypothetical protein n=1 Tax=Rhodovulum sp. DZ06 TaxID=3425126 RepID=UPI003D3365FE
MSAPVLVVLRLGADHRVSGWAKTPRAARDWDLVLSPYQEVADLSAFEGEVVPAPGGKWEALHALFVARPELWEHRARIWMPDDDLEGDAATVARFLALARARELSLAQPALTPDSAFSHFVTVRHLLTTVRYTNFVELMAPLATPEVLRASLPMMEGRAGAKGLDYLWARGLPPRAVGVVDAAPMRHARPLGGALAPAMAKVGRDLEAERAAFFAAHLGGAHPRSRSLGHDGPLGRGRPGRACVTLAGALTVALSPPLWRRAALVRAGKTLWAQIARADDAP